MSRALSAPRCSTPGTTCRRTCFATASAIRLRSERAAAAALCGLLGAGLASIAASQPVQEGQPSLSEAARRNRARVEASRRRHGPAPRFTDADLARGQWFPPEPGVVSPDSAAAFSVEAEELPLLEPGADTVDTGADELQAAMEARLREIGEREAAIRERLLDIEASLTAIGVSGLPTAPRNPNRFQNPLAAGRLRSERRELQQELEALAVERGLLR